MPEKAADCSLASATISRQALYLSLAVFERLQEQVLAFCFFPSLLSSGSIQIMSYKQMQRKEKERAAKLDET